MSDSGNKSQLPGFSEINEIDICVLRRLRELTGGDHASVYRGSGFNFAGTRDWQPGDRLSAVDWPQSALNNYDPILVREFEEGKSGIILIVADASLSMRCGANGVLSNHIALRAIATLGFSGVFFQDLTGLFMFDHRYQYLYARPRLGKNQVVNCLSRYNVSNFSGNAGSFTDLAAKITANLKRTSIVPVISDFLYEESEIDGIIRCLNTVKLRHDLFVVMIDCSFLFNLESVSDSWIECVDVENGRTHLFSKKEFTRMANKIIDHQERAEEMLKGKGIEVIKVGVDKNSFFNTLIEFFFIRRTKRKVSV